MLNTGKAMAKTISVSELRVDSPKYVRSCKVGKKKYAITYYEQVVGFLVPVDGVPKFPTEQEKSLTVFRDSLNESWESLLDEVDVIYLTYHNRRRAAFVSARHVEQLGLDLPGLKLMEVA